MCCKCRGTSVPAVPRPEQGGANPPWPAVPPRHLRWCDPPPPFLAKPPPALPREGPRPGDVKAFAHTSTLAAPASHAPPAADRGWGRRREIEEGGRGEGGGLLAREKGGKRELGWREEGQWKWEGVSWHWSCPREKVPTALFLSLSCSLHFCGFPFFLMLVFVFFIISFHSFICFLCRKFTLLTLFIRCLVFIYSIYLAVYSFL